MIDKKIGIIGCGNMGEAIFSRLAGVLEKSTSLMVSEYDAKRRDFLQDKYKIIVETDNNRLVKWADVIILAVKPKDIENVLKEAVCCGASSDKLIMSIAAGITTKFIESIVGEDVPVIRVMPNMPAVIGEAVSAISRGSAADSSDIKLAEEIFSLIGDVVRVDEKFIDAVTAVSGSGPAYFFYLAESLMAAAKDLGLDEDTAKRLVMKTALGSAKMLYVLKEDPSLLRARVTSKGGTTEAAIKVFESKNVKKIVKDAAKRAARRSKELSSLGKNSG